jgi:hypothetical protein
MLAGTLALTPVLAAEVPRVGGPMPVVRETTAPAPSPEAPPEQPLLPGETRSAPVPGPMIPGGPGVRPEELRPVLEAILAKLDALAERPIDIAVTTQLDGRQIAQSVYRDLRERKIKNYETL